ncbi:hypothetical protein KC363_g27 [Hortaea werneckii]|nr:hypothetical protein KC363_g27 [Hortaea werneckii]
MLSRRRRAFIERFNSTSSSVSDVPLPCPEMSSSQDDSTSVPVSAARLCVSRSGNTLLVLRCRLGSQSLPHRDDPLHFEHPSLCGEPKSLRALPLRSYKPAHLLNRFYGVPCDASPGMRYHASTMHQPWSDQILDMRRLLMSLKQGSPMSEASCQLAAPPSMSRARRGLFPERTADFGELRVYFGQTGCRHTLRDVVDGERVSIKRPHCSAKRVFMAIVHGEHLWHFFEVVLNQLRRLVEERVRELCFMFNRDDGSELTPMPASSKETLVARSPDQDRRTARPIALAEVKAWEHHLTLGRKRLRRVNFMLPGPFESTSKARALDTHSSASPTMGSSFVAFQLSSRQYIRFSHLVLTTCTTCMLSFAPYTSISCTLSATLAEIKCGRACEYTRWLSDWKDSNVERVWTPYAWLIYLQMRLIGENSELFTRKVEHQCRPSPRAEWDPEAFSESSLSCCDGPSFSPQIDVRPAHSSSCEDTCSGNSSSGPHHVCLPDPWDHRVSLLLIFRAKLFATAVAQDRLMSKMPSQAMDSKSGTKAPEDKMRSACAAVAEVGE